MKPRLLAFVLLLVGLPVLCADRPAQEVLPEVSQETGTAIKFTVQARTPGRFAFGKVHKDGRECPRPGNMTLDPATGAFAWTPTPSQAGTWELSFTATDENKKETSTTFRVTVRARAITTLGGEVGELLKKWYAEGTAAGNTGDFYDNRDRDHSALHRAAFPQLDEVMYTDEDRKAYRDWALQINLRKDVTFGNSSTSAPVTMSGSNIRTAYVHPRGLPLLYQQYRGNNLYIYPAHHDHREGLHGKPFYGDVLPVNSPYLIASQGSSGSDQPFMRAVPLTLAAFRPEVKKKLIDSGLLMPTVQMLFRSSNKHLKDPKEYLSGKAHPPVFEGAWVDELKMVKAAHEMTLKTLPPMIQLKVVEEDEPVSGKDYFDGSLTEKIADSPAAIARVVRGGSLVRRMVVSAEESFDENEQPLTWQWVVLRGDRDRIRIQPLNAAGSRVELLVPYHGRRPVADAPFPIESSRVDIGAFVHNGTHWSAPGFVTFFYLDNESRHYDEQGRLRERGYGLGATELTITDWNALFDFLKEEKPALAGRLLLAQLTAAELPVLAAVGAEYREAAVKLATAQEKSKQATEPAQKQEVQKAVDAAAKAVADVLGQKRTGLELPAQETIDQALRRILADPRLYVDRRAEIDALASESPNKSRFTAARQRLIDLGILKPDGDGYQLLGERPTAYEKCMSERFHGELISALFYPKFLHAAYKVHLVDQRLFTAKAWRDVYRYDGSGRPLGWTRDEQGRPVKTRTMKYDVVIEPKQNIFQTPAVVKSTFGGQVLYYEYAGDADTQGKVVKRESIEADR